MIALCNGELFTNDDTLYGHAVLIEGDTIVDIVPLDRLPRHARIIDVDDATICPGFVDLQVNGGGGVLFNDDPSLASITQITAAHRRHGTTSWLPTYLTGTTDDGMQRAVSAVDAARADASLGVVGIHFEGPFLHPDRAGVHDSHQFTRLTADAYNNLPRTGGVNMMTVAPEQTDSHVMRRAVADGWRLSAGHTTASYEGFLLSTREGISGATHLYNAMGPMMARSPGVVGGVLASDSCVAGIIVDGYHIHYGAVHVAYKAKSAGQLYLVTDAMPPAGEPSMTEFQLNGHHVSVTDGRCHLSDGTLAGSSLTMADAVRNAVDYVHIPKDEAIRMASMYPADYIGQADHIGSIAPGCQADIVIMDARFRVQQVMKNGVLSSVSGAV